MEMPRLLVGRERIVDGTTAARQRFPELFEVAASGTPVLIVSGDRQVLMVERGAILDLLDRLEAAEEALALATDPEALRRLVSSHREARAGEGPTVEEAARLLGLEE